MRYSHAFIALVALLAGTRAAAQVQAAVQLTASVPPVLVLRTEAQAGVVATSGQYTEIRHAVVLRVKANCRWRLVAVPAGGRGPVWVRAVVAGRAGAFQAMGGGGDVAQGTPARETEIVVDYRVPAGSAAPAVSYQVQVEESAAQDQPAPVQAQAS